MPSGDLIEKAVQALIDDAWLEGDEPLIEDNLRGIAAVVLRVVEQAQADPVLDGDTAYERGFDAGHAQSMREQQQADHDAAVLEQAADEIDLAEPYLHGASEPELHNAEAAAEVWLRDRAARIREGVTK